MSGIYGIWRPFEKIGECTADIDRLQNWNKAYGHDSQKRNIGEELCLGCSYEKLSEKAVKSEPVLKKGEKYAVIDALLYNRKEIMEKGQFSSELSDEELIWAYIEKFGLEELKNVNGDFCGAIYDTDKSELTLFRDHMGVRPLFYYAQEQIVTFSTDIRGLTSMQQVDVSVDEKWLWNKIAGTAYMGTENTEFAHIFCIKPGSYITFTLKSKALQSCQVSYWQPGSRKVRLSSETAYIERMRELITDSVKRRLDAVSGPVGAELSGGLDSGVIDILINRLGREGIYFSWSASPEEIPFAENDERLIVEDICKQEKISCHYKGKSLRLSEDNVIEKKMSEIGAEPNKRLGNFRRYAFPPYVNTLQICHTSQHVKNCGGKVVFTGHGGDEGVSHRCNPYELFFHKEYFYYLQYMWDSTRGDKHRIYKTLLRSHKNLTISRKKLTNPYVSVFAAKDLLNKDFFEKYNTGKGMPLTFAYDPLSYIKSGGSRNRLDVVALLGAYCGVRYIIPYLDYRVIDFAVSIPRHMYLKKQKNRYIFREAFKDIMPESLYQLSSKEDNSWKSVEKKERDAETFLEGKKNIVALLDRDYWEQYLNWEVVEQWANEPLYASDESRDMAIYIGIDACLGLQNIISFSRSIVPTELDGNYSQPDNGGSE